MKYPKYKYVFAVFDFAVILISFFAAKFIAIDILNKKLILDDNSLPSIITFVVFSILFIFIFQNNYLYKINVFLTRAPQLTALLKSFIYGAILLIIFSFVIKFSLLLSSRVFMLCFIATGFIGVSVVRLFILKPYYMNFSKILHNSNVIIIGAGKSGKLLAEKLIFENFYGMRIAGFLDDNIEAGAFVFKEMKCLGKLDEMKSIVMNLEIDEIIIAIDNIGYEKLMSLIDRCNELEKSVKLTSELFNIVPEKIVTETYSGIPVVDLSPKVNKNINYIYKRVFDYVASITGLIILSPVFIIISILIKLTSPGKIFFTQMRIGKDGKPFKFYKFRSMKINSDSDKERESFMIDFIKNNYAANLNSTKIINENNITSVGKFIRKTSLDELPQLINVLKGDMSLVGPRPCLKYEYDSYDDWHKRRHTVMPGCTGVWQVSGRSTVSFRDSVVLDLYYINNMTPWLDLQLIFKTFPVMIFGRGAK
ncbi:MAG: sugar transferase [Ignavibacteria bacterium]|nr:sugar transferase [Ignavibacteria bacterium]MBK7253672.1 sugar transferase [Ignavibacteria bacterium]MBK7445646.1 sugar transferase [Ignavibacteria bacterium]MBK9404207.1 sugar transferase [Ignavibacteria bacterium]MBL0109195.1 sugar transferase [Ignavibacteria bacterium]